MSAFIESVLEEAALEWLGALGYAGKHGTKIAAGGPAAKRSDAGYSNIVVEQRLHGALRPHVACRKSQAKKRAGNLAEKFA